MQDFEQTVAPGFGLGPLLLGSSQADVRPLLMDPTSTECVNYGDGIDTQNWEYEVNQLSLTFSADESYRLGAITSRCPFATLNGVRIVGIEEEDLLRSELGGIGPPTPDDDFGESGRDYLWDSLNITCWVRDEDAIVDSVTIMPLYDEAGEAPQWLAESANKPMQTDAASRRR